MQVLILEQVKLIVRWNLYGYGKRGNASMGRRKSYR